MQLGYRSFGFLRRTFRLYTLTTQNNLTPPLSQILVFKTQKRGGFSMVLATMANHSSMLGPFFLFPSVQLSQAQSFDINPCALVRA